MKIAVAGATGAIGRLLVPELVESGHEVTALGRSAERLRVLEQAGARVAEVDVYDKEALQRAMSEARPEIVIDELTSLPQTMKPRGLSNVYKSNDRVRWEGGGNVLEAARAAGARRHVLQSSAFWYAPGPGRMTEDDPFFTDAPDPIGESVRTMKRVEERALASELETVILRYGSFYGPGTWYAPDGEIGRQISSRRFPMIGSGDGVSNFVFVGDAAHATTLALDAPPGIYNVCDDEPARQAEWLPVFAEALGAKAPLRVPVIAARAGAGKALVTWLTESPAADNSRAKAALGWELRYPSWRRGLVDVAHGSS
ncbi:MAG TPA: NAD(P)-dependent oxidoreductase [Actinomycetota bacterium]|nr:NAD(P)-dependent oxidoreductase [Actinomycetota bacterium]